MTGLVINLISKLAARSTASFKLGLVLFALTALLTAGASTTMRLDLDQPVKSGQAALSEQVSIHPDPADISAEAENMNTGSAPNGEPSAIIGQFILTGGSTSDQAKHKVLGLTFHEGIQSCLNNSPRRPINSIALVNSELGRRLTLVGAKPDGTS